MNEATVEKHRQMVYRLEKPGADILKTLTPELCSLIHVGPCLGGEVVELWEALEPGAVATKYENDTQFKDCLREELGDFEFYLVANFRHWNMERRVIETFMMDLRPKDRLIRMMILCGQYWDVVKRAAIYRKPIDKPDSKYGGATLQEVAELILRELEVHIRHLEQEAGLSLEEVLEANYLKLADADKGRYAKGYSDQAAQDRQDKPDGAKG